MTRTDLDEKERILPDENNPQDEQNSDNSAGASQGPVIETTNIKKKNTKLSIIALILSIIGITRPVGMLLAIFDGCTEEILVISSVHP